MLPKIGIIDKTGFIVDRSGLRRSKTKSGRFAGMVTGSGVNGYRIANISLPVKWTGAPNRE
jgi:hypothetical protein